MDEIKMAQMATEWEGNYDPNSIKSITFCVTEDCNLECRYCYMTGKNKRRSMTFETAKKCVDYILENKKDFKEDSVIFEFIGGEPFLEIDLIEKVCDYIKFKMFKLNHPWFNSYRFSFSTNGLLYKTDRVQKFINKNKTHLSIGISIDGNKIKHDLQRVYPNGTGSYDDVIKNIDLWLEQFPEAATKATFSHDDLVYLKDSIISLWKKGIKNISANVVFEDVWEEGDDLIFEDQLNQLGDYILENKLYDKYYVRFFEPNIGNPIRKNELKNNFCGSGKMLAIDTEGNFYPCIRFLDFSLNNRKGICTGKIGDGFDKDRLRPFKILNCKNQSSNECLKCEVASGCAWCTGFNYDTYGTIFKRATFNCKMHKANVRANKTFWNKFEIETGKVSPRKKYENISDKKFLQFLLSDDMTPICSYNYIKNKGLNTMSKEIFEKGVKFAKKNNYEIILIGDIDFIDNNYYMNMVSSTSKSKYIDNKSIVIYDNSADGCCNNIDTCILLINKDNIKNIYEYTKLISMKHNRINLFFQDLNEWTSIQFDNYEDELDKLIDLTKESYANNNILEINILSDRINFSEHCNCDAGLSTITLAPDGNIYPCPAFYYDRIDTPLSNIDDALNGNYRNNNFSDKEGDLCITCDAYQCKACKYLNKKYTGEYNVSPKNQCLISHIERKKAKKLQSILINDKFIDSSNLITDINYSDPLEAQYHEKDIYC